MKWSLIAFAAGAALLMASCSSEPDQVSVYWLPSELPTSVNPVAQFACSFTITTAEPGPVAWPGLAWINNDVGITMLGEGFEEAVVLDIAEALEPVSRDVFLAAGFDPTICDLVNE